MISRATILLSLVAGALCNTVPLKVGKDLKIYNLDVVPKDISWLTGKSKLVKIGSNAPLNTILDSDTTCHAKFSCSGCNEAQVCQPDSEGHYKLLTKIKCPTDMPYCDENTGTCSTVPGLMCGEPDSFICMDDGYFPDTYDCQSYHVCQNGISHKFQCVVKEEQYNPASQKCERSLIYTTFSCNGVGRIVSNYIDSSYYAYCNLDAKGLVTPYVVEKCPGSNKFNETSQQCEIICSSEGVFEDIKDCTKYYECERYWIDGTNSFLIKRSKTCPTNTSFSLKERMCIIAASNNDCADKDI